MKNKILTIATMLLVSAIWCRAYTITNFSATTDTSWATNVVPKLNSNNNNFVGWLNSIGTNLTALNSFTNWGGGTNSVSIAFTNTVTLPSGSSAYVTNLGYLACVWTFQAGIPAGPAGTNTITNTITAYAFSNQFLSSRELVTYSTNNFVWGTSNFLARVNGLYDFSVSFGTLGGGGLSPGTSVFGQLNGSYTGTNAWFVITNGFTTTNMISIAATGAGGGQGSATLFTLDHWELLGRINYFFGQQVRFGNPVDQNDAATKGYADALFANAFNNNWSTWSSNGVNHFVYSYQNYTVFDIASTTVWIPIQSFSIDGTGTNVLIGIAQTNLANGYQIQSSTNLALVAGFLAYTNYTMTTNSGVVTFKAPINLGEQMRFYRAISSSSSSSSAFYVPVAFNGGTLFPSNTWSLATITNGMKAGDIITVNSNGLKLVDVWMSNSTPVLKPHW